MTNEKEAELKLQEQVVSEENQEQQTFKVSQKYQIYKKQFYPQIENQSLKKLNFNFNQYKNRFQTHDIVYHEDQVSQSFRTHLLIYSSNWRTIDILVTFSYFSVRLNIFNLIYKENFDLSSLHQIGSGSFGRVLQFSNQKFLQNHHFAIKILNIQQSENGLTNLLKQVALLKLFSALQIGLSYKKLFQFDIIIREKQAFISMEKGVSIQEYFGKFQSTQTVQSKIQQIQKSIKLMHLMGIVHMDIKPQNMLFSSQFQKIVLIDFGLSEIKQIRPGFMEKQKFRGSLFCCSEQMQHLFYQQKQEFIDVFYNDYICWKKTRQFILLQSSLNDEQVKSSSSMDFKQSINRYALNNIQTYIYIFKTVFLIKKNQLQAYCKEQDHIYLTFLKTNFQTIFFMLDLENQAFTFLNFVENLNFQIFQEVNELIKKRKTYNNEIKIQVCRIFQYHQQKYGYFKYDSSLSILFEDMDYSSMSMEQQFIVLYRKFTQSKEFVSYWNNRRIHELLLMFKKKHQFIRKYCVKDQIQYFKIEQLIYAFNFLIVQSFVKVVSQFSVKKIIQSMMVLTGKQNQLKNRKDLSFQQKQYEDTHYFQNYNIKRFSCLILLWKQMSSFNILTTEDVIKKTQFLKVIKRLMIQCEQILIKENQLKNPNKIVKATANILLKWIIQQYFIMLINHFFQLIITEHYQIMNQQFKQICQLQKSQSNAFLMNKALTRMRTRHIKILYQIQFIPTHMLIQLNFLQLVKNLFYDLIQSKHQIIWPQFQNLVLRVINTFTFLLIKFQRFQLALQSIKYCENLVSFQNIYISFINKVKYKLAATLHNNRQELQTKNKIHFFDNQDKKNKKQPNKSWQSFINKKDNCWTYNYQKMIDQYSKKQFIQNQILSQTLYAISDRLKIAYNKMKNSILTTEQKQILLQEYEKNFQIRKSQIQNCSELVSFHARLQQVKIKKILQIWSQYMILLISHQKQSDKIQTQKQLYYNFVIENLLENSSQFIEVDFRFNKKIKNDTNMLNCALKYLTTFKNNLVSCDACFYVQLLNQFYANPSVYLNIKPQVDYRQLFFSAIDYLIVNKMTGMFFKYFDIMLILSKNFIKICTKKICQIQQESSINFKNWQNMLFRFLQQLCLFVNKYPCSNYSKYLLCINQTLKSQLQSFFQPKKTHINLTMQITAFQKNRNNIEYIQNQIFQSTMAVENLIQKKEMTIFMFTILKVISQKQKVDLLLQKIFKYISLLSYNSYLFILKSLYWKVYFVLKCDEPDEQTQKQKSNHKRKTNYFLIKHFRKNNKRQIGQKIKGLLKNNSKVSILNLEKLLSRNS